MSTIDIRQFPFEEIPLEASLKTNFNDNTFEMLAYDGGLLRLPNYPVPVVVDLQGMEQAPQVKALMHHKADNPAGHMEAVHVLCSAEKGCAIHTKGRFSVRSAREELLAAQQDGFQWEASIGAAVDRNALEPVPVGREVRVNGRTFQGPLIVARHTYLKEVSFTGLGAGDNTNARLAAAWTGPQGQVDFASSVDRESGLDDSAPSSWANIYSAFSSTVKKYTRSGTPKTELLRSTCEAKQTGSSDLMILANCGTGKGGFQAGNNCARGGQGGASGFFGWFSFNGTSKERSRRRMATRAAAFTALGAATALLVPAALLHFEPRYRRFVQAASKSQRLRNVATSIKQASKTSTGQLATKALGRTPFGRLVGDTFGELARTPSGEAILGLTKKPSIVRVKRSNNKGLATFIGRTSGSTQPTSRTPAVLLKVGGREVAIGKKAIAEGVKSNAKSTLIIADANKIRGLAKDKRKVKYGKMERWYNRNAESAVLRAPQVRFKGSTPIMTDGDTTALFFSEGLKSPAIAIEVPANQRKLFIENFVYEGDLKDIKGSLSAAPSFMILANCGTGLGGFQAGNRCARGAQRGGSGLSLGTVAGSKALRKSTTVAKTTSLATRVGAVLKWASPMAVGAEKVVRTLGGSKKLAKAAFIAATAGDFLVPMVPAGSVAVMTLAGVSRPRKALASLGAAWQKFRGKVKKPKTARVFRHIS